MQNTVIVINECARRMAVFQTYADMSLKFAQKLPTPPASRFLLREDSVNIHNNSTRKQRKLLLFNDVLFICKKDWRDKQHIVNQCAVTSLQVFDITSDTSDLFLVAIDFKKATYCLAMQTASDKTTWLELLKCILTQPILTKPLSDIQAAVESVDLDEETEKSPTPKGIEKMHSQTSDMSLDEKTEIQNSIRILLAQKDAQHQRDLAAQLARFDSIATLKEQEFHLKHRDAQAQIEKQIILSEQLTRQLALKTAEADKAQSEQEINAKRQDEIERTKDMLANSETYILKLQDELALREIEKARIVGELKTISKYKQALDVQVKDLILKNENLNTHISAKWSSESAEKDAIISSLQSDKTTLSTRIETLQLQLEKQEIDSAASIYELSTENSTLLSQIEAQLKAFEDVTGQLSVAYEQDQNSKLEIGKLDIGISEMSSLLVEKNVILDAKNKTIAALEADSTVSATKLNMMKAQLESTASDAHALRVQLTSYELAAVEAHAAIKSLSSEKESIKKSLEDKIRLSDLAATQFKQSAANFDQERLAILSRTAKATSERDVTFKQLQSELDSVRIQLASSTLQTNNLKQELSRANESLGFSIAELEGRQVKLGSLQIQIKERDAVAEGLRAQVDLKSRLLDEVGSERNEIGTNLQSTAAELAKTVLELSTCQRELNAARESLANETREHHMTRSQLSEKAETIVKQKNQLILSIESINQLEFMIQKKEIEITQQREQFHVVQRQLLTHECKIATLSEEIVNYKQEAANMLDTFAKHSDAASEKIKDIESIAKSEISALKEGLAAELKLSQQYKEELTAALFQSEQSGELNKREQEVLTSTISQLESKISNLTDLTTNNSVATDLAMASLEDATNLSAILKLQNDQYLNEIAGFKSEIVSLSKSHNDAIQMSGLVCVGLRDEIATLSDTIDTLKADISAAEGQIKTLKYSKQSLEDSVRINEGKIVQGEQEIAALLKQISGSNEYVHNLQFKVSKTEAVNSELESLVARLDLRLSNATVEIEKLQSEQELLKKSSSAEAEKIIESSLNLENLRIEHQNQLAEQVSQFEQVKVKEAAHRMALLAANEGLGKNVDTFAREAAEYQQQIIDFTARLQKYEVENVTAAQLKITYKDQIAKYELEIARMSKDLSESLTVSKKQKDVLEGMAKEQFTMLENKSKGEIQLRKALEFEIEQLLLSKDAYLKTIEQLNTDIKLKSALHVSEIQHLQFNTQQIISHYEEQIAQLKLELGGMQDTVIELKQNIVIGADRLQDANIALTQAIEENGDSARRFLLEADERAREHQAAMASSETALQAELAQKVSELNQRNNEIIEIRLSLENSSVDGASWMRKILELQEQLASNEKQYTDNFQSCNKKLQAEISQKEEALERLAAEFGSSKLEIQKLLLESEEKETSRQAILDTQSKLSLQVELVNEKYAKLQADYQDIELALKTTDDQTQTDPQAVTVSKIIEKAKSSIDLSINHIAVANARLRSQIQQITIQLDRQGESHKQQLEDLKIQQERHLNEANVRNALEMESLKADLAHFTKKYFAEAMTIAELESENRKKDAQLDDILCLSKFLSESHESQFPEGVGFNEHNTMLKEQINKLIFRYKNLKQELAKANADVDVVSIQMGIALASQTEMQARLNQKEAQIAQPIISQHSNNIQAPVVIKTGDSGTAKEIVDLREELRLYKLRLEDITIRENNLKQELLEMTFKLVDTELHFTPTIIELRTSPVTAEALRSTNIESANNSILLDTTIELLESELRELAENGDERKLQRVLSVLEDEIKNHQKHHISKNLAHSESQCKAALAMCAKYQRTLASYNEYLANLWRVFCGSESNCLVPRADVMMASVISKARSLRVASELMATRNHREEIALSVLKGNYENALDLLDDANLRYFSL